MCSENINTRENAAWWEYYFYPIPSVKEEITVSRFSSQVTVVILFGYFCLLWLSNYIVMTNVPFMEYLFSLEEKYGTMSEESLEMTRVGFTYLHEHTWLGILFTGYMTLKTLVIVGTMMVVAALSTFRYRTAKSIIHIQQVLYWGALSTLPLVIGSVLYAILRVLMVLDMTSLSAALAFPYSARRGVLFEFVNSFDLFTVWFIVLFASRLAKLLHDDFLTVFTYLIVAHILAVAISFLLRVDSILSLFLK